jgi:FkbM family methyltransferase
MSNVSVAREGMRAAEWKLSDTLRLYCRAARALGPLGLAAWRSKKTAVIPTRLSDHQLVARGGTSDRDVFYQIFVDREYRCIDHLTGIRTIIDAGANVGYSSAYLLTRFPDAKVIALEPDAGNFNVLQANLAPWGDRVTCLKAALWSEPTTLDFRSETLDQGAEWGRQVEQAASGEVVAVDIPTLLRDHCLETIDLLKVDIEGAEREVFRSPDWLPHVRNMVVEIHGPDEDRIFHQAVDGLPYLISHCDELTVCLATT